MNITTILSIIDYNMDMLEITPCAVNKNEMQFRFIDYSCHGSFNKITSEVTFIWCTDSDGTKKSYTSDTYDGFCKLIKCDFIPEEAILDLLNETVGKEPFANIPLDIDTDDLVVLDSMAAKDDLTRNSFLVKCLLNAIDRGVGYE